MDEPPAGTEALELTGEEPEGPVGEVTGGIPVDSPGIEAVGVVSVTGHTVVEMAMVEVTTEVESAGQLVTVGAQLVTVISLVVYTVEVVHLGGTLGAGVVPAAGDETTDEGTGTPGTDDPEGTAGLVGGKGMDEPQESVVWVAEGGVPVATDEVSGTEGGV